MTGQLPLFSADPAWLAAPRTPLERRFAAFHGSRPDVYEQLEERALALYRAGEPRVSVAQLVEELRKRPELLRIGPHRVAGRSHLIDNSFRALYARLLIHRHPTLAQVIETRHRRERVAS